MTTPAEEEMDVRLFMPVDKWYTEVSDGSTLPVTVEPAVRASVMPAVLPDLGAVRVITHQMIILGTSATFPGGYVVIALRFVANER
jgi:hypothetical protein